ncbi:MAG TPA: dehydrogenase [Planctomycetaceae bacterium]|nr:dehydrogenase [Planctomycetaceae bacterium]
MCVLLRSLVLLRSSFAFVGFLCLALTIQAAEPAHSPKQLRVGMIGLDTSHAPAFTKLMNDPKATGSLAQMRVVAAFPGGSEDIATSRDRVGKFTAQLRDMDVKIVDSIEALIGQVDAVLLESVDGRKHLDQVRPVFEAGLPVFIDKPLGGDLTDAIAIAQLGEKHGARWFSSSSLRFSPSIYRFRQGVPELGKINGAAAWGPYSFEPTHSDLYWYGVHGAETLYTAMGTGCETVTCIENGDIIVVGQWSDGRTGTLRGIASAKQGYGLVVFGEKQISTDGRYEGYAPLVNQIGDFFLGQPAPVTPAETLEIFTFMKAAELSKAQGGTPVSVKATFEEYSKLARQNQE